MANTQLQGTGNPVDLADAKTAAAHGDTRLAVFLLCRYHGGELNDLWKFVSREKQTDDPPGAVLVSSGLRRKT